MVVYKVVRSISNSRVYSSAIATEDAQLIYCIGVTTKAKPASLGVFVFETLQDARNWNFIGAIERKTILECETTGPLFHPMYVARWSEAATAIKAFLGKKASFLRRIRWTSKKTSIFFCKPLKGAATVPAVRPIKRVY